MGLLRLYIIRTVRNPAFNVTRRRQYDPVLMFSDDGTVLRGVTGDEDIDQEVVDRMLMDEQMAAVLQAFFKLPEKMQTIMSMRCFEDKKGCRNCQEDRHCAGQRAQIYPACPPPHVRYAQPDGRNRRKRAEG